MRPIWPTEAEAPEEAEEKADAVTFSNGAQVADEAIAEDVVGVEANIPPNLFTSWLVGRYCHLRYETRFGKSMTRKQKLEEQKEPKRNDCQSNDHQTHHRHNQLHLESD